MIKLKVAGAACAALLSMLVLASAASATVGIVIPAGDKATLSGAEFCADDSVAYGFTLDGGSQHQVASGTGHCDSLSGNTTIGLTSAPRTLVVYLTDSFCSLTYYSDGTGAGDHALVTVENAWTWGVSITDCGSGNDQYDTRVPSAGAGNLNVTVTLTPATGPAMCATTTALVHGSLAYTGGSGAWRTYVNLLLSDACGDMVGIQGSPIPLQPVEVNIYDAYTQVFAADGFLTSAEESFLDAAAGAL